MELREGEGVFFSHKVVLMKNLLGGASYNFAITNQRIALVPYKKDKEVISISYADIYYAQVTKRTASGSQAFFKLYFNEKKKLLGFLPVHVSMKFVLQGKLLENLALFGKSSMQELKGVALNYMQILDYQSQSGDIDRNSQLYDKSAAKSEAWAKVAKYWESFDDRAQERAAKAKKLTPCMRAELLVDTVNEVTKLIKATR